MRVNFPQELVTKRFPQFAELLNQLQNIKGRGYGSSWCKHGLVFSVFPNLQRKWDRIENVLDYATPKALTVSIPGTVETLTEGVIDLAVYCQLLLIWLSVHDPVAVKKAFEKDGIEVPESVLGPDLNFQVEISE